MADTPTADQKQAAPPLEGRVTFALHQIMAQLARITNPVFSEYDLDLDTARIIVLLLGRKTMLVSELIDLTVLPQSTVSHQLRRLEKRGLLSRQRLASDKRSVALMLTPQGKKVAKVANGLSEDVYAAMTANLTQDERRDLMATLSDIFQQLKAFDRR